MHLRVQTCDVPPVQLYDAEAVWVPRMGEHLVFRTVPEAGGGWPLTELRYVVMCVRWDLPGCVVIVYVERMT